MATNLYIIQILSINVGQLEDLLVVDSFAGQAEISRAFRPSLNMVRERGVIAKYVPLTTYSPLDRFDCSTSEVPMDTVRSGLSSATYRCFACTKQVQTRGLSYKGFKRLGWTLS